MYIMDTSHLSNDGLNNLNPTVTTTFDANSRVSSLLHLPNDVVSISLLRTLREIPLILDPLSVQ